MTVATFVSAFHYMEILGNRFDLLVVDEAHHFGTQYLHSKLERLRDAAAPNLILCIDDSLNCADDALPEIAHIIRYKRRIDVAAVLAVVEAMTGSGGPSVE